MLKETGHPLVDVGFATIAAHVNKNSITAVTADDLETVAAYLEAEFVVNPLRSFLTVAFTSNAWFIQDAYNPDKPQLTDEQRATRRATRKKLADAHLRQWQQPSTSEHRCVFTGEPAVAEVLSNTLTVGRAARAQIPLLQGDDTINFFPNGNAGLPVSGIALLALQAFPLGSAKAGNGILVVHSANPRLTLNFAKTFYQRNKLKIGHAHIAGDDRIPGEVRSPKTLLIETLFEIQAERENYVDDDQITSIVAYNLNNGKTPSLAIYELPHETIHFMIKAKGHSPKQWNQLVHSSWEQSAGKKSNNDFVPRRNYFYEDMFDLPNNAKYFIRRYFLKMPYLTRIDDDIQSRYYLHDTYHLIDFPVVELFLREVFLMDDLRIERIKQFGDKLANYIRAENGKRFFRTFAGESDYTNFRQGLIKSNEDYVRVTKEPLFTIDEYVDVFERQYSDKHHDWRLSRDLVLIRIIEQLKDWLGQNPDALPERPEPKH
ncbi:type I-B CRISPR-associated protein Cas8b1/Cst1 [Herpetosiphon giganteus]|uniref:type I-B CRISPR-associated protein Cas8b1/Cst1 n=1 Tax=Herpetosiphon giganteus TaxID=2029754 RepID=UPI00195773AF|nr:type I-B CRISPR-associated protein Cas8b1/Cst1 [Herpetosiphon giganteus]MBM7846121.1 CRISPR-associated protein Cst1 [Herpetosiphon giganteus]